MVVNEWGKIVSAFSVLRAGRLLSGDTSFLGCFIIQFFIQQFVYSLQAPRYLLSDMRYSVCPWLAQFWERRQLRYSARLTPLEDKP